MQQGFVVFDLQFWIKQSKKNKTNKIVFKFFRMFLTNIICEWKLKIEKKKKNIKKKIAFRCKHSVIVF